MGTLKSNDFGRSKPYEESKNSTSTNISESAQNGQFSKGIILNYLENKYISQYNPLFPTKDNQTIQTNI
jgi:hypothetical protein